jgi:hypothetical protein
MQDANVTTYEMYVEAIHPYAYYKTSLESVALPSQLEGLPSREWYDRYIDILTEEYKQSFSLAEIRKVAEFYQSPLGRKVMEHGLRSQAFSKLLSSMGTAGPEAELPKVWTCPDHREIRTPNHGRCPICSKPLELTDNGDESDDEQ